MSTREPRRPAASRRGGRLALLAAVLATSPRLAHGQATEAACLYDFYGVDAEAREPFTDFRALAAYLRGRTNGYLATPLTAPVGETEASARAAICLDGGCAGSGPWLVRLVATEGSSTTWVLGLVGRVGRRLGLSFVTGDSWTSVCEPATFALDVAGLSLVARVSLALEHGAGCVPLTAEYHFLADARRVAGSALRVAEERRGPLGLSYVLEGGERWRIGGCGREQSGAVTWMTYDGRAAE